ncbi:pre-toxin TG domain-containing protein [Bacillus paramycoides]|uniref:pre-toxin TG domain-containing protein n=1 Tax=Bacillus paramycoides TaxID=2026194 RepID=UPI003D016375
MKDTIDSIWDYDEDRVVRLPYKSKKGKYQGLKEDYNVLHDFSGKVGGLIDTEIDQPFYEDMDAFAEAMRDLTIDKYETSNTIGAKETIMTGSYGQTAEHIKDKIKVSDIFSSNNFFMTSLKAEFDAYKKENPKDNMSYVTYQQRRLNSRAFNYDSIKDQQQDKEFWRDVGILGTTQLLAGAALFAFTASVGVMEVSSAVTGKDWLTQRKLDTNERWLRGLLGFVDVAPVAKGLHAFGNVTTGLKSGVSTTTIKGASQVGLEEGGWDRSFLQRG